MGDYAANDHDDVLAAELLELCDDLRHKGQVACGERRNAHYMHVVLDGLLGGLFGSLEQRTHIDVEADVGIAGGDYFGPPVMAVLTQLGDHDARLAAFLLSELLGHSLGLFEVLVVFHFC